MPGLDPERLSQEALAFLAERHLASLTTIRRGGLPHVVPVGFTYDAPTRVARVITSGDSVKARNAGRDGAVAVLCQFDGARWITLSGPVRVATDPATIRDSEQRYAARYRTPRVNPRRVALIVEVTTILGSVAFSG